MFHATRKRLVALICLILLAIVGAVLSGALRRRRPYVVTAFVLIVAAAVSAVAGLVVLDSEPARYGVQEDIAVRIALLLLVIATLDVLVERRSRRAAPTPPAPTLPAQRTESAPPSATSDSPATDSLATPVGVSDAPA